MFQHVGGTAFGCRGLTSGGISRYVTFWTVLEVKRAAASDLLCFQDCQSEGGQLVIVWTEADLLPSLDTLIRRCYSACVWTGS